MPLVVQLDAGPYGSVRTGLAERRQNHTARWTAWPHRSGVTPGPRVDDAAAQWCSSDCSGSFGGAAWRWAAPIAGAGRCRPDRPAVGLVMRRDLWYLGVDL